MDISVQKMFVLGFIGCVLACIGAYMYKHNKDGSGWGFLAFCFLVASCEQRN